MHAIWLSVVAPPLFCTMWVRPTVRSPKLWIMIFGCTTLAACLLIGIDLVPYLYAGGAINLLLKRALFVLVTATDLPVLALCLATAACWLVAFIWPVRVGSPFAESADLVAANDPLSI